ncbi:hypothetical protein K2X85_12305 [bacterium]|nr:hypothetical protein [bacterium]
MKRWLWSVVVGFVGLTPFASTSDAQETVAPPSSATPNNKTPARSLTDIEKLLGKPASIDLLWQVIERDLKYGLIDQASKHLQDLMGRGDLSGEKLLELREKFGVGLLSRLKRQPELAEQAKPLLDMLTKASQARSTDVNRIRHFISKLDDSSSERSYAIEQLNQSGPLAVPYYLEAFREGTVESKSLLRGMLSLPRSAWAPLAAALDAPDESIISLAIDILTALGETTSVESIYPILGNNKYSAPLRERARQAIAKIEGISVDEIGSPVDRLIEIARHYDESPTSPAERNEPTTLWAWKENNVTATPATRGDLEEYLGLRAARSALDINPESQPAKVVFLKLALENSTRREGIDRVLPAQADGSLETALAAGPELLTQALEDSLAERRPALAVSAVRALAHIASPSAITGDPSRPSVLIKALDFPNSRVRFEAAITALEIHANQSFAHGDRVVATLSQAIDPRQRPTALVLDVDLTRGQNIAGLFQEIGYEPIVGISGTDGFKQAMTSGLVELLVIDSEIRNPDLLDTIASFEKDGRTAGIPVVVIARQPLADTLIDRLSIYPHVLVLPPLGDAKKLAEVLASELSDTTLAPWTEKERNDRRQAALAWLVRLARGEMPSVDVRPAIDPLTRLLNDEGLSVMAAEALSYLPSASVQASLAATALDGSLSTEVRTASASALARNLARGGNAISQAQAKALVESLDKETDATLRQSLAAVVGAIDRRGSAAAERMKRYRPRATEPAPSPAEPLEPTDEKDKP